MKMCAVFFLDHGYKFYCSRAEGHVDSHHFYLHDKKGKVMGAYVWVPVAELEG